MSNEDITWNEQALKAWNRWKETCSVANLTGIDEQKNESVTKKIYSDAELAELTVWQIKLSIEIKNAFEKKFSSLLGEKTKYFDEVMKNHSLKSSSEDKTSKSLPKAKKKNAAESEPVFNGSLADWAHEFDCGVINTNIPEAEQAKLGPNKVYKDFVWAKLAESDDPPLKIIRGKLLGKYGIINGIAERYLRENYFEIWVRCNEYKNAKSRKDAPANLPQITHISINHPQNESEDDTNPVERIPDPSQNEPVDSLSFLAQDIRAAFTCEEIAFMLAKIYRLLSDPDFLQLVGKKREAANEYWNKKLLPQLRSKKCYDLLAPKGAVEIMINILKESEKASKSFLLKVEQRSDVILMRRK